MLQSPLKKSELLKCPIYWVMIALPMSIIFLNYPVCAYLDQPLEAPLLESKSVFKKGSMFYSSKSWTWIEVEGKQYRCSGTGIGEIVIYQKNNPSKCRVKSTFAFPNHKELMDLLAGILFGVIALVKLYATPQWVKKRRERFYNF